MVPCLETSLALVWSVRMTSEDPNTPDRDPMQSWSRCCTLWGGGGGGVCTLDYKPRRSRDLYTGFISHNYNQLVRLYYAYTELNANSPLPHKSRDWSSNPQSWLDESFFHQPVRRKHKTFMAYRIVYIQ